MFGREGLGLILSIVQLGEVRLSVLFSGLTTQSCVTSQCIPPFLSPIPQAVLPQPSLGRISGSRM